MNVLLWLSIGFLFYVYLGYPLLIACSTFLRFKKEEGTLEEYPPVTMIIAAYNEEKVIRQKLMNALELDYPHTNLEIIVAADGSDDGTKSIVESFAPQGVILCYSPERRGKMAAITRAVEAAHGEILIFSDANNYFSPYALRYLVDPFADPRVGGTTGAKHIRKEDDSLASSEGLYWKYESWIKKNESIANTCTAAAGEILALRRELFPADLSGVVNDDFYVLLSIIRQGFRIAYIPQAESWERVSRSAQDEIKRRARITAGRFQALANSLRWMPWNNPGAVWQIFSHKYFRLFIPFAMLLALISNIGLAIGCLLGAGQRGFFYLWLLVLQILFYLLAFFGRDINYRGSWKILYLPVFLVNSNLATLQGFFRHFRKEQDVSWERVNRR